MMCHATGLPVLSVWVLWTDWNLLWVVQFWFGAEWNTSRTKSQRSRAGIPPMRKPASREIISDSVEQCETDVCFLHIQLTDTNVWLPNMHNISLEVDFESSRSPPKSESWNSPNLHCCAVFTQDDIVGNRLCDECTRSNVPSVCHMLLSISLPHAQSYSQTIKCQVSQNVPNTEQFVSTLSAILLLIHFPLLWIDGHPCMALRLCFIVESFYSQVRNILPHISLHDLPCRKTMKKVSASGFPEALLGSFFLAPAEILDSNISLQFVTMSLLIVHILWVQPKYVWPQNIGSSNACHIQAFQDNLKPNLWQFSNRSQFCFFEAMVVKAWSWYFV